MEAILHETTRVLAMAIEVAGLTVITVGLLISFISAIVGLRAHGDWAASYETWRKNVGRALLLGLEFLLAAEIARSIMIGETLNAVLVLGLVVIIRTFLSIAIDMEINGRWPWRAAERTKTS
ncbi:MAG: DUF1622 domain-containing protein [Bradymonadaceae bacterium]